MEMLLLIDDLEARPLATEASEARICGWQTYRPAKVGYRLLVKRARGPKHHRNSVARI